MNVKVCGVTSLEDAQGAVELGAWAVGMVHYRPSPRCVDTIAAAEIAAALHRKVELVGVFVNPTLDYVATAAENARLSIIQLSGTEGASFCTEVARRTGARVIKAIHVDSTADVQRAEVYRRVDFHLFDSGSSQAWGGTGKSFDWDLLAGRRSRLPFILAGGLNPDNVAEAARTVRPWAVDVASGIESSPGVKDHNRMASFFEAVRDLPAAAA